MNPTIFREYDIRGLAEKDFDGEFARLLGEFHGNTLMKLAEEVQFTLGHDCHAGLIASGSYHSG